MKVIVVLGFLVLGTLVASDGNVEDQFKMEEENVARILASKLVSGNWHVNPHFVLVITYN